MKKNDIINKENKKRKKIILKSGFIPFVKNNKTIEILLMVPSNPKFGGNMPQFAKGEIEKNLSPLENALKEAEEELGLIIENILFNKYLCKEKNIYWFYGELKNKKTKSFCFETKEIIWCNINNAINIIRNDQIPILEKLINELKKII